LMLLLTGLWLVFSKVTIKGGGQECPPHTG